MIQAPVNCLDPAALGFASVGVNVLIRSTVRIVHPERIHIGSHVMIDDFVFIGAHEELVIGNHVHIGVHTALIGGGRCYVSDFAGMSIGVKVMCGSDDFLGGGLTNPTIPPPFRAVHRGEVWLGPHAGLGAGSIVFPDVAIGEGSMVAAGSVVTRSLGPWGIYGGHPARRIKPRPSEHIRQREAELLAAEAPYARSFREPAPDRLVQALTGDGGL
ncbi:MAG: acyltransferase [Thiomonas sp.]